VPEKLPFIRGAVLRGPGYRRRENSICKSGARVKETLLKNRMEGEATIGKNSDFGEGPCGNRI